jgi:hypothetical protein
MNNHSIPKHPGFEIVEPSSDLKLDGKLYKLAYGGLYTINTTDLEIELDEIKRLEGERRREGRGRREGGKIGEWGDLQSSPVFSSSHSSLKECYRRCVGLLSPTMANGWNAWSDLILDLFLCDSLHKVMFGSGNCGKSRTYAMLLYIKWRVNPTQRLILIASAIMADSSARVFGYLEKIHGDSPTLEKGVVAQLYKTKDHTGIFRKFLDKATGKYVIDQHAGIVSRPVKVNAKREELGANLMGYHPEELFLISFDEGQELDGSMVRGRIYINMQTNTNVEIHAWGNPPPIRWHSPESWDMLNTLGLDKLSLIDVRKLEKEGATKTSWWKNGNDTTVLHLSMMESPKDRVGDLEGWDEKNRLHFLGGLDIVEKLRDRNINESSPAWYSQILGFPYIDEQGASGRLSVVTPSIVEEARRYPLVWRDEGRREDWRREEGGGLQSSTPLNSSPSLLWFMGVDPSGTGYGDDCAISVGRVGVMVDGRRGIDLMNGRYNESIKLGSSWTSKEERQDAFERGGSEEFTDLIIGKMWEISKKLGITLGRIAIETHGCGEVFRYALQKKLKENVGMWQESRRRGESYYVINPMQAVSDRYIFQSLGKMEKANMLVSDFGSELWMAIKCAFLSKQLFNAPDKILKQLYNRGLDKGGVGGSGIGKWRLESKKDMKKRGVKSPNDADALSNMIELMRVRGAFNFQFALSGGYVEKYGIVYNEEIERKKNVEMLGKVGRMLQLGNNFSREVGSREVIRRGRGNWGI